MPEYHFELKYNDIENILLKKEQELKIKFQFKYSGNSIRLNSLELPCLLFTVNEDLWWIMKEEVDVKVKNNYEIIIKESDRTIFHEKAIMKKGKPIIEVKNYSQSTMNLIARDLLKDIIPNKGYMSPMQRLWD